MTHYEVRVARSNGDSVLLAIKAETEDDARTIAHVGMIHTFNDRDIEIVSVKAVGAVVMS